ncbi:trypsin-like serine protease [Aquimarina sp. RZ0]|uniref:trypsin-like serine protease n=1 Tax=Aquimarina sp. RZ0 TaxID=2607730 RepID=UPI001CB74C07|nr:trypsin-like serine protease [Aquimarina sp. RZ0]
MINLLGQTSVVKRAISFPCDECDLSLLELETPLDLSGEYAKAIKYASADVFTEGYVQKDMECYATGWGQLGPNGGLPDHLQGALLKFGEVQLSDELIGVEETEGRMVCRGDSGGPLVVFNKDKSERILVGAVSGGEGTPCTDYGFWGNVANAAIWIQEQTGIEPYKEDITLGIADLASEKTVNIWPVPARDVINVSSKRAIKEIKIYNLSGKKVLQSNQTSSIAITSLPTGMYLLQDAESLDSSLFAIKR